jgi:hypothetical protein
LPPPPYPFGNDPSVKSVLVWQRQNVFAFSSNDCSGVSRQPSYIAPLHFQTFASTICFSESSPQILPPMASVSLTTVVTADRLIDLVINIFFSFLGYSFWIVESFPNQACYTDPQQPLISKAVGIIDIFADYVIPLLFLAGSLRSWMFRRNQTRLTLPRFSRLWFSRYGRQDRSAAWFVACTFNDFIVKLCLNYRALSLSGFLFNWFDWFPVAMAFRPVMVCLLFLQPDRVSICVSVVEGCLIAASSFMRLQFLPAWMFLPRAICIIPPVMFTLTTALVLVHPKPSDTSRPTNFMKNFALRIRDVIF